MCHRSLPRAHDLRWGNETYRGIPGKPGQGVGPVWTIIRTTIRTIIRHVGRWCSSNRSIVTTDGAFDVLPSDPDWNYKTKTKNLQGQTDSWDVWCETQRTRSERQHVVKYHLKHKLDHSDWRHILQESASQIITAAACSGRLCVNIKAYISS